MRGARAFHFNKVELNRSIRVQKVRIAERKLFLNGASIGVTFLQEIAL
jgi:hypothetical protein